MPFKWYMQSSPPFNICMQEYFSIGLCTKCMSLTFKFAAQFSEVINFPIIGESIGLTVFLVDHWLLSALWVNHNKASMHHSERGDIQRPCASGPRRQSVSAIRSIVEQ